MRATFSAFNGAQKQRIHDFSGMCDIVMALSIGDFYKSMTTHADDRIWQDVYYAKTGHADKAYVKLTVIDDVLIVSCEEL